MLSEAPGKQILAQTWSTISECWESFLMKRMAKGLDIHVFVWDFNRSYAITEFNTDTEKQWYSHPVYPEFVPREQDGEFLKRFDFFCTVFSACKVYKNIKI